MVKSHRLRRPTRTTSRRVFRRLGRRLDRPCLRPARRSGPDDVSQALTAFNRAIRCHRRLARLAPESFDATTVARTARDREQQRRWMALWKPAFQKMYGTDPSDTQFWEHDTNRRPPPGKRKKRAMERELAGWGFWMAAGRLAMERHRQRRPHALISFNQIARLLQLAFDFKQLVLGDAMNDPPPTDPEFKQAFADLQRAYPAPASSITFHGLNTEH